MSGPELPGVPARNHFFEPRPTNKKVEPINPGAPTNEVARDLPRNSGEEFLVNESPAATTEVVKNEISADVVDIGHQPDSIDKLKNYGRDGRLEK